MFRLEVFYYIEKIEQFVLHLHCILKRLAIKFKRATELEVIKQRAAPTEMRCSAQCYQCLIWVDKNVVCRHPKLAKSDSIWCNPPHMCPNQIRGLGGWLLRSVCSEATLDLWLEPPETLPVGLVDNELRTLVHWS